MVNIIELIIDHNFSKLMKFPDVLNDAVLPNNMPLSKTLSEKEKKKQKWF